MPIVKLKSFDGDIFKVDVKAAERSKIIKNLMFGLGIPKEEDADAIPVPNIKGSVLKKVLDWSTYHIDDPVIDESDQEDRAVIVCEWDRKYLDFEEEELMELILAANYLENRGLLDVCLKILTTLIRGKTEDQLLEMFEFLGPPAKKRKIVQPEEDEAVQSD